MKQTLQSIADITEARYFRATNAEQMSEIYKTIDALETSEVKLKEYAEYEELFYWPLGLGAFSLCC